MGLFKPTCVASFGFARQLLQLGVVVVGALVVFVPIYARILAQLKKDSTYRSFARVKASITDFYKGDFGQEVFTRLGKIFHLVDVQWPLLAYKAFVLFGATPTATWHPRRRSDAASRTTCWVSLCLLVFVIPVPLIQEFTIRREYELRGGVHAPHVQALFGWSRAVPELDLRPGRHAGATSSLAFYLLAGCGGCFGRGPGHPALPCDPHSRGGVILPEHVPALPGVESQRFGIVGMLRAVAACALGVLGIEDNSDTRRCAL